MDNSLWKLTAFSNDFELLIYNTLFSDKETKIHTLITIMIIIKVITHKKLTIPNNVKAIPNPRPCPLAKTTAYFGCIHHFMHH